MKNREIAYGAVVTALSLGWPKTDALRIASKALARSSFWCGGYGSEDSAREPYLRRLYYNWRKQTPKQTPNPLDFDTQACLSFLWTSIQFDYGDGPLRPPQQVEVDQERGICVIARMEYDAATERFSIPSRLEGREIDGAAEGFLFLGIEGGRGGRAEGVAGFVVGRDHRARMFVAGGSGLGKNRANTEQGCGGNQNNPKNECDRLWPRRGRGL